MSLPETLYINPRSRSSQNPDYSVNPAYIAVEEKYRKDTDIAYVKQTVVDEVIAKISARDAEIERLNRLLQEAYIDPEENSGIP